MIKVTLGEKPQEEKSFPKFVTLGRGTGGVFLALSKAKIVCLDKGASGWYVGEIDEDEDFKWDENNFKEITVPITIQNA